MTKQYLSTLVSLGLIATSPALADDKDTFPWKTVGGWEIRVDPSVNNGCFMAASFPSGDYFRLGFDRQNSNGYVMVMNRNWASLVVGNQYPIAMQFDLEAPWEGNATARLMGSLPGLALGFKTPNVMKELAEKSQLKVFYKGKQIAALGLKGSAAAVDELVKCQDAADKYTRTHALSRPTPPSTSTNPFAQ